tara:strand:- start:410 stop:694 length:285 start_codon:yes stop_codon:yes gene_type:complete
MKQLRSNYAHTFLFDYELDRDGDTIEVEVIADIDYGDVSITSVKHNGREIPTSPDEDKELQSHAFDSADEAAADAEADYGDWRADIQREEAYDD